MYMRVFICVYAWIEFICICECLYVYMHGSSLYVNASVYMCICMDRVYMYMRVFHMCICMGRVYMYMRVFIGVYAWIEFICICECLYVFMHGSSLFVYASVYMCICMDQVYLYMRVLYVYMHGSSLYVYAWIEFICTAGKISI